MLEMLVALDFVRDYRDRTFEANGLVKPMRPAPTAKRDREATAAPPPATRSNRLAALALRRSAA
jgi:hypothetical protein